ncbi:TetR/AcrR family transcriptional regulator [Streptomyces bambusae]|uniref:TetR/AcrR family transcriptional regulator n=1 Tax=Streptomyces bambusae TaxID=1550616 RepID=UPI001CFF9ADE|nr:TetR/AcrR family transcriptional regulator [Streptomyces bambusae]MCB5169614.1 TetR/AcrR family transcriptional regulator [Streptomyces bambusae]
MQTRSAQTRQALIRAAAELIADGGPSDAGLVSICRRAGVSRGALYHHFSSTAQLMAAVYEQAHERVMELAEKAFDQRSADGPERFLTALTRALREEELLRAGIQLSADGSPGPPQLRDEVLTLVRRHVSKGHRETAPSPDDLADLAVVVAAGLESLGHTDPAWWEAGTNQRLWALLRPLFGAEAERIG